MKIKTLAVMALMVPTLLYNLPSNAETCPTAKQIKIECDEDFCVYIAPGGWFYESKELSQKSPNPVKFDSANFIITSYDKYNQRTEGEMGYCAYKMKKGRNLLKLKNPKKTYLTEKQKVKWVHTSGGTYNCTGKGKVENCQFTFLNGY